MRNKKRSIRSKMQQAVSGVIVAAMMVTAFPVLPVHAETNSTTYSFEGYDVEYSVISQWENGQTVEVKVTNTGEESIVNWAFMYDAEGTISSIWNAAVVDNKDTKYVIKNDSWNYEIASGQSVNFGYTLMDAGF